MPAKSKAQFRAMQAAAHGNSTLGIPEGVGREFATATSRKRLRKLPARVTKSADPYFNSVAADTVYKAMAAMDDETALVFGRILVADTVRYDLNTYRDELAKIAEQQVDERARRLREHYIRQAVAKTRAGQDNTHEISCLVQIGKAWNFTTAERQRFTAGQTRGEGGRFVQEHHRIATDPSKPPITDKNYAEKQLGIPHSGINLSGGDLAHYQQAYGQIQDMLAPFHGKNQKALLHLNILGTDGSLRAETHGVSERSGEAPKIGDTLKPGDRIESAAVSVNPAGTADSAVFDSMAAAGAPRVGGYTAGQMAGGALNSDKLKTYNQARTTVPENENFSASARAFGRLERGSQILQDGLGDVAPRKLQYALAVANHVGQYGPEAQKVIGPAADRAAYRYRGTEREVDPTLLGRFAQIRAMGRTGKDAREIAVAGIENDDGWAPGPVLHYFHSHLPNPDLNELQRRSGVIPPSEGIILAPDGAIAHQSVGYADDWYLPFNLRHLGALKGGEYIRTRSFGGPSTEDIYTGLVSGARALTVVSHNGVFNIQFDRNLRGGRRFNDKAARMVARYGQLLDAVRSEQVSRGGISPSRTEELMVEARNLDPDETSPAFKNKLRELRTAEMKNPAMSQTERDDAALTWLGDYAADLSSKDGRTLRGDELIEQMIDQEAKTQYRTDKERAARAGVAPSITEEQYRGAVRQSLQANTTEAMVANIAARKGATGKFDRAMAKAGDDNAKRARALRLDGEGYEAALTALQEQFPYYIESTTYTPWRGSIGSWTLGDRTREGRADTGYVAPRFNRPQAAQAGYFNDRVGQGKVEASSIRNQNYRVTGGRLRPVDREKTDQNAATSTAAASTAATASGPNSQHTANMALADELLAKQTFDTGARVGTFDMSNRNIRAEVALEGFPNADLARLYKAKDRAELESMPPDELTSLLDRVLTAVERDKLVTVGKGTAYAFRNGGKTAPLARPPDTLREKLNSLDDNHSYPGIAYDPTRAPTTDVIETAYAQEPTIQRLVRTGHLDASVADPAFEAKIAPLKSRLQQTVNAHAQLSSVGGRPNSAEAAQADRDADGLLRAAQLRRNWVAAKARADAATPAVTSAAGPTNTTVFATNMTPQQMQQWINGSDPNAIGPGP